MNGKKFYINVLLTITYIFCCCSAPAKLTPAGNLCSIGFRTIGGKIPLVQASLNDKIAWFIVDTGATITLLNAMENEYFGFSVWKNHYGEFNEVRSFADKLNLFQTSLCNIRIGDLFIRNRVWQSQDMNALFFTIANNEKIRIAGILGSDILAKYKINVNYDTQTLSYRVKGPSPDGKP